MTAEHVHRFKPIIARRAVVPGELLSWEMIVGYEPCECGLPFDRWCRRRLFTPSAQARAAAAYMRARYKGFGRGWASSGRR